MAIFKCIYYTIFLIGTKTLNHQQIYYITLALDVLQPLKSQINCFLNNSISIMYKPLNK